MLLQQLLYLFKLVKSDCQNQLQAHQRFDIRVDSLTVYGAVLYSLLLQECNQPFQKICVIHRDDFPKGISLHVFSRKYDLPFSLN